MRGIYDDRDQHANGVRAGPAAAAESIIQARTVQKTYDTDKVIVPALRGVGLHIDQGDSYHHGASGCGKTPPLTILSGLDDTPAGAVKH